jgi:hypothetical protein
MFLTRLGGGTLGPAHPVTGMESISVDGKWCHDT